MVKFAEKCKTMKASTIAKFCTIISATIAMIALATMRGDVKSYWRWTFGLSQSAYFLLHVGFWLSVHMKRAMYLGQYSLDEFANLEARRFFLSITLATVAFLFYFFSLIIYGMSFTADGPTFYPTNNHSGFLFIGLSAISLGAYIFASVAIDRSDGLMLYVTGFHALRNSKSVPKEQTYQVISRQQSNRQLRPSQSQSTMKSTGNATNSISQHQLIVNQSNQTSRVASFADRTSTKYDSLRHDSSSKTLPKPTTKPLQIQPTRQSHHNSTISSPKNTSFDEFEH
ncbi:Oidioi.mRNA.OKI2018_I69.PAR.g10824.t1.cds [Oikopleura dioica]|uniref:Oidioi.mRNA.OKI2018_I69.PAR.g10824.t1.cds n=1 Tax=Oikopleura dioica TaxID=34765 RepID=A0ABN7RSQ4_OIKDI|nr:Oidioi.mRNA.OKI2018_I69.PAR.g10824.t1.cds [Oikopleura dioica]